MITQISSHVPLLPLGIRRQLVAEVHTNGEGLVFDNRVARAERLRKEGDLEFAQQAEREAGFVLDVYA